MHTILVVAGGFALLLTSLLAARMLGEPGSAAWVTGAKLFIPIWFVAAAVNMVIGVTQAGYSVADEAPMFLLVFGVPAIVAAGLWWHFSRA
jgi:hypothetical protein